jgi:uncharacterized protein (TIGR00369 family)
MDPLIERDRMCFCCGADNERGLRLSITYPEKGTAETALEIPPWFTGWRNMTHGGLLAMVLDEIMAHACLAIARKSVTAEITVRYQKPVEAGARIRALGKVEESRGRVLRTRGWIYDAQGSVVAEVSARFIAPGRVDPLPGASPSTDPPSGPAAPPA